MTSDPRIPDPGFENFFTSDRGLQALLRRHLDDEAMGWALPRLQRMGELAATEVDRLAFVADDNPPRLEPFDRRGERTERIAIHPAYARLKEIAYGEGLISDHYTPEIRRRLGVHAHRVKFALGYLYAQGEQGVYCPVCMTDGAGRLLEKFAQGAWRDDYLARISSRPPAAYWQGAMFLTEKQCGSDVGATETVARPGPGDTWLLTGDKWFCSNAETDLAMVLARPEGACEGTRGLALFAMPRLLPDGTLNPWRLHRLKDKLGTRSMPTGEATLEGATAYLVGSADRGFAYMTDMLNLSRLYNAVASVALIHLVTREAEAYCRERRAFGNSLDRYPLVQETLVGLEVELEAALALVFETIAALDRLDSGDAGARPIQRILTPLTKLYTAKLAVRAASESLELLGGNGYVEDRVTARFFRDAQVLPVWEGTTNILVLDCFRALSREKSLQPFVEDLGRRAADAPAALRGRLEPLIGELAREAKELLAATDNGWTLAAKPWCERAARLYQAVVLAERAGDGERAAAAAHGYFRRQLVPKPGRPDAEVVASEYRLLVSA